MTPDEDPRWKWMVRMHRAWRELVFAAVPKRWLLGKVWRWLFLADDGSTLRRVGEIVLADLRDFAGMKYPQRLASNPIGIERQQGRRDVVLRVLHFIDLDETQIQKLVEVYDE